MVTFPAHFLRNFRRLLAFRRLLLRLFVRKRLFLGALGGLGVALVRQLRDRRRRGR